MNGRPELSGVPGPGPERQAELFALLYSAEEVRERAKLAAIRGDPRGRIPSSPCASQFHGDGRRRPGAALGGRLVDREFFAAAAGRDAPRGRGASDVRSGCRGRVVNAAGETIRQVRRVRPDRQAGAQDRLRDHRLDDPALQHVSERRADGHGRRPGLPRPARGRCSGSSSTSCCTWPSSWAGAAPTAGPTNFHALSRRIFAHEGAFHDLVTPREQAAARLRHPRRRPRSASSSTACATSAASTGSLAGRPSWSKTRAASFTPTASDTARSMCRCRSCDGRAMAAERGRPIRGTTPCDPDHFGRSWQAVTLRRNTPEVCTRTSPTPIDCSRNAHAKFTHDLDRRRPAGRRGRRAVESNTLNQGDDIRVSPAPP